MSSCPVNHGSKEQKPISNSNMNSYGSSDGCPVSDHKSKDLNRLNFMPKISQEIESPNQKVSLPRSRVTSSIPKGQLYKEASTEKNENEIKGINIVDYEDDGDTNWVYPSEQQFYNALHHKGYQTDEKDIPVVVAIHNELNERSWQEVCKWESKQ